MMTYLKAKIRNSIVNRRHPELQSGQILKFETVRHLNESYSRNGTIEDPISPLGNGEIGYSGEHLELADIFTGIELGTWAIDSRTMDWLWDFLNQNKPNTILEFGSGSSTCLFCAWMKKYNKSGIVISIEQSKAEAEKTSARLSKHGMANNGRVLFMETDAAGKIIVDHQKISQELHGKKVDMLFVDGPAGPTGCRENTLKDSIPVLARTGNWFLHDAYRTGELDIINQWNNTNGIFSRGILAYGNGLCVGNWNLE